MWNIFYIYVNNISQFGSATFQVLSSYMWQQVSYGSSNDSPAPFLEFQNWERISVYLVLYPYFADEKLSFIEFMICLRLSN